MVKSMAIARYLGFLVLAMLCVGNVLAEMDTIDREPATVFTQPGCSECKKAIAFLESGNRKYKEIDITQSEQNYRAFESLGGIGTPFTLFNDYRLHGFDTDQWNDLFLHPRDDIK